MRAAGPPYKTTTLSIMKNPNPSRTLAAQLFGAVVILAFANRALAEVHYVDLNSTNATPPYTNWATAATNIQDAVDAAVAGDEVVVTNGIFNSGFRDNSAGTSRVVVDKPLNLRSVNGPEVTQIHGFGIVGCNCLFRCAYLTNGATLSGFTLTNGWAYEKGGGVLCESGTAVVSNCVLRGNKVFSHYEGASVTLLESQGGGACGVTLKNCTLTGNSAKATYEYGIWFGQGPQYFAHGGGAYNCTLKNCVLGGNLAYFEDSSSTFPGAAEGGGASYCTLNNCMLTGNSALLRTYKNSVTARGGGASDCVLNNCNLVGNQTATFFSGYGLTYGSGASGCTLNNCISSGNASGTLGSGACVDCDSPGRLDGNNWYGDPLFVDTSGWANLRLQSNSPCINAGDNSSVTNATDLDGNARISGGTVDIGAYEYQWPQLTVASSGPNVLLTWPMNNAGYDSTGFTLQSTTNLIPPVVWTTNSPAPVVVGGLNTVSDAITGVQRFYRLVQ